MTVAVGAVGHDEVKGQVRVFKFNGTVWRQMGQDLDGEEIYDYAGYSVSLSSDGMTVAVGAVNHDEIKGQLRVFYLNEC